MPETTALNAPRVVVVGAGIGGGSGLVFTDFVIHDKSAKKSFWIGIGETKNGVALVSHDPRRDVLTVNANGIQKQLPLRKASTSSGSGAPASAPITFQQASPSSADANVASSLPPPGLHRASHGPSCFVQRRRPFVLRPRAT